jgi:NADH:ubiquinone oxidoreductase subunit 2 (subunit N)
MTRLIRHALLVLLAFVASSGTAHAYIDGGSAHLMIQGLIAAVIGGLYYLRNPKELWLAIKRRFRRDKNS